MSRSARRMLVALQALVLGLPLFLGGRQPAAAACASVVVLVLLGITLRERRRVGAAPAAPGVAALAVFGVLALATTVPLPPAVLQLLEPASARLYAGLLPGWPGDGGWSTWRAVAFDPYAVWVELGRLSIACGIFAVLVGYPWEDARAHVLGRLVLTFVVGGALLGGLALVEQVAGNGDVLWITGVPVASGRASGPFVNPNHFAGWLEMVVPLALVYAWSLARRVRRQLVRAIEAGRGIGVRGRRAWVAVLVVHQQRLWPPLVAAGAALLMGVAHLASGSRGGLAALLVGLAVAGAGIVARQATRWRWAPAVLAFALVVGGGASVVGWVMADADTHESAATDTGDVSLAMRLAVSAEGSGIVRDHPLLGTGLGSWLHAFRPYVEPPIEGGIWDHAHDDYLELAAETGIAGVAVILAFAVSVVCAIRRRRDASETSPEPDVPADFRRGDWARALGDSSELRWGLAGGLVAILMHSAVDFSLHMPANLLLAMTIIGLLVLSGRPARVGRSPALGLLLATFVVALVPRAANSVLVVAGGTPLAPEDCLRTADLTLAAEGEPARPRALALVHRALDRSPADRDAHTALAEALGPGPEGDEALRRALALEPWSADVRDQLGLRLLARGEREAGAAELEESMYRFPYLASHAYLSADVDSPSDPARLVRALAEGDTLSIQLAALESETAAAIERGLRRALDDAALGENRVSIANDLVSLLEARERWSEAAVVLAEEGDRSLDANTDLGRAARNYLKAHDFRAAEQSLLAALLRTPEQGQLYRDLAVEVYAARGDFPLAERVIEAGQRNALDMLPVYEGVTEVLTQRESAQDGDAFVGPEQPTEEMVP